MSEVMNPSTPDGATSPISEAPQPVESAPMPPAESAPMAAAQPAESAESAQSAPMSAAQPAPMPAARATRTTAAGARPGLVTFAAVMLFLIAGFQLVFAVIEFYNAAWFASTAYGTFSDRLWLWGIVDVIIAAIAIFAGYDLFRGGKFGRIVGLIAAAVIGVRWFFYLPADPWSAVVMIALAVLVIYGLVANSEYFDHVHAT